MSKLINVADAIYEDLTRLKKAKDASYSTIISELLAKNRQAPAKTQTMSDLIAWAKERNRNFKGKREKIDHDLIAHGVSRDGS